MTNVVGYIEAITQPKVIKKGNKTFNTIALKVGESWYSAILNDTNSSKIQNLSKGDKVDINFEINGNFKNIVDINLASNYNDASTAATPVAKALSTSEAREYRITYMAARKDALAFAELAFKFGAVPVPKKQSEIEEVLLAYVNTLTNELAHQAWTATPNDDVDTEDEPVDDEEADFEE